MYHENTIQQHHFQYISKKKLQAPDIYMHVKKIFKNIFCLVSIEGIKNTDKLQ